MRWRASRQRVESGLKGCIIVDLVQNLNEFLDLLLILQRITDQPLPLLASLLGKGRVEHHFFQQHVEGLFGKDMLGNDLLQLQIGRVLILLETHAYLTAVGCEHRNDIIRLVHSTVAVGIGMLCHGRFSWHVDINLFRGTLTGH